MFTLDGAPVPPPPPGRPSGILRFRVPNGLRRWAYTQAEAEHLTINAWLNKVLADKRDEGALPGDVTAWLRRQAALIGVPGDTTTAITAVVRQLAERYPHGVRLTEE